MRNEERAGPNHKNSWQYSTQQQHSEVSGTEECTCLFVNRNRMSSSIANFYLLI